MTARAARILSFALILTGCGGGLSALSPDAGVTPTNTTSNPSPSGAPTSSPTAGATSTPTSAPTGVAPTPTASGSPAPSPSASAPVVIPIPTPEPTPSTLPQFGPPFGGSGTCATTVQVAIGSTASILVSEPGYSGTFTVLSNATPATASASIASNILRVNGLAFGTTTIIVADNIAHASPCSVTVP